MKATLAIILSMIMAGVGLCPRALAGTILGPKIHPDRVMGRSVDTFIITFRAGEIAHVAVVGDGDTDLDLFVYNENGEEIGRDTDLTDKCVVEWIPQWTREFTVRVVNFGYVYNNYLLITN